MPARRSVLDRSGLARARPLSAAALRRRLLNWWGRCGRDLPWRQTRDPYAIWVSEVMLQQTTVAAVGPYWERFVSVLPNVRALARAPEEQVLQLWSGLGYYARARRLHHAARILLAQGLSAPPADPAALRQLPGIGRYTAAAIASIAFGIPEPAVDGNVARVLARLAAIPGRPHRGAAARRLDALAHALLHRSAPGAWNQALMDLGATLCTSRRPKCPACPLATACAARAARSPERYPTPARRPSPTLVVRAAVRVRDARRRVLLARAPVGGPNAGLWELPAVELRRQGVAAPASLNCCSAPRPATLARRLRSERGLAVAVGGLLGRARHAITRHRIVVFVCDATLEQPRPPSAEWRWVAPGRLAAQALTGEARKLIRLLKTQAHASQPGSSGPPADQRLS